VSTVELAQTLYLLLAALGLALSVSYAGLPVLSQGAFVAVGGFGTALLGPGGAGLPLAVAVVLSVSAAALAGALVALAGSRLSGASLALATWGLTWLVAEVLRAFPGTYGGEQGLVRLSPVVLVNPVLGVQLRLTPAVHVGLALGLCVLCAAALARLGAGPGGLDLAALREGPALAAGLGVPVAARRRVVLAVTAGVGGLAGAGSCVLLGLVAQQDVGPLLSLQLFVAVLVGGTARWWGPVLGVALLAALPPLADAAARDGGLDPARARGALTAALLVAVLAVRAVLRRQAPAGGPGVLRRQAPAGGPGVLRRQAPAGGPLLPAGEVPRPRAASFRPVLLRARGVTASYGSLRVLSGVDLQLRAGQVHALVGPNGSGKSTLLRVLAGELAGRGGVQVTGTVELAGSVQPSRGPERRVLAGVVRTPQRTVLLPGLDAAAQVAVGARGGSRRAFAVVRSLLATPSARAADRARRGVVAAALRDCGLGGLGGVDPARLAVGQQRLLQVARAVATGADVLLLDEPAAGMSADERARLVQVLRVLAGNGHAVLLVEHDMRLVDQVADRVSVLDGGSVVATGRPADVRSDPAAVRAYLGTPA